MKTGQLKVQMIHVQMGGRTHVNPYIWNRFILFLKEHHDHQELAPASPIHLAWLWPK